MVNPLIIHTVNPQTKDILPGQGSDQNRVRMHLEISDIDASGSV
jgi:hypothetical protein